MSNTLKFIGSAITISIWFFIIGGLIHGVIFGSDYAAMSYGVPDSTWLIRIYLINLIEGILATFGWIVLGSRLGSGFKNGLKFGFIIFLLSGIPASLATFHFGQPLFMVIALFTSQLFDWTFSGGIAALIIGERKK